MNAVTVGGNVWQAERMYKAKHGDCCVPSTSLHMSDNSPRAGFRRNYESTVKSHGMERINRFDKTEKNDYTLLGLPGRADWKWRRAGQPIIF
jgi:hypothetical protein